MKLIDTNIIMRLLTNDVQSLVVKARSIMDQAASGELCVTDIVVEEVCSVLEFNDDYNFDRSIISSSLLELLNNKVFTVSGMSRRALEIYRDNKKLDIVDCMLATEAQLRGGMKVVTFDKGLNKYLATSKG
jgi:predicted nucleic-acid-binding protein